MIVVRSFCFLFCSFSSLTVSVKSLMITINFCVPSISTVVFFKMTERKSVDCLPTSFTLYMVDSSSNVCSTSLRVRTLYPSSFSSIELLFYSVVSSTLSLFSSWKQRLFMIRYWLWHRVYLSLMPDRLTSKKLSAC